MTDVSIVIVSHGHEAMLPACLESLDRALAGLAAEIILVDNLQDGAVRAACADLDLRPGIIENPVRQGFAANANKGAAIASGRHLLLLNPDTAFRAGHLADAVAFLDARPDVGILGCRLLNHDGTSQQNYRLFPTVPVLLARAFGADGWRWRPRFYRRRLMGEVRSETPFPVDWIFGAFMLMRRDEFVRLGGMDDGFYLYYEDVDLCWRFRQAGLATWMFPAVQIMHEHLRTSAHQPLGSHWRWHVKSAARYFWKSGYAFSPGCASGPGDALAGARQ